jgi:hypothetical protein
MHIMVFRFRRSFRLIPGIRLNLSKSGVSTSIGTRGAWLTIGRRGTRATVGIPGTGLSYTEQSAWARPTSHALSPTQGIEVAELPREEIEVPPVLEPLAATAPAIDDFGDVAHADPRLLPIVLAIVGIVAIAAIAWALLV